MSGVYRIESMDKKYSVMEKIYSLLENSEKRLKYK